MSLENIRKLFNENNWQFIAKQMSNTEGHLGRKASHNYISWFVSVTLRIN